MSDSVASLPRFVTRADLETNGFSTAQIERLEQLKAQYPYIEFIDSVSQFNRLAFLKWQLETGRVSR
jgi:hypothetical protein